MLKFEKSQELTEKFNEYYPGGHSNFRVPLEVTKHRLFIDRAEGSHIWDIDGNEYIEFNGAMGPSFLGHRQPEWAEAIKELFDTSTTAVGSNLLFSKDDITAAEYITKMVPCVEQLKFCITGTEAVQMAIRIARAYTGKSRVIRFENHYHGWVDNVLGGAVNKDTSVMPNPIVVSNSKALEAMDDAEAQADMCRSAGRSPWAIEETLLIPWNDFERLEETFDKYHDEIAMIHFEQIVCNHMCLYPKPGFIEKIRELCDKYNVVMSVDEVITGFRVGPGGAQEYLGTKADICTMGKAISGGIPVSAVGGKKKIMEVLRGGSVLGPGTYNGYPLGMRAVAKNLEILSKNNYEVYNHVKEVQDFLMDGLIKAAEKAGIPMAITHAPGIFCTLFGMTGGLVTCYTEEDLKDYNNDVTTRFQALMQERGVFLLLGSRWYMNIAHTMEDAKKAIAAAEESMLILKEEFYA